MYVWSLQTGFQKDFSIYFYILVIISLWLKSKTHDSEFHNLAIKLKIKVHNDIDTKKNEYALTGFHQSASIDLLKPVCQAQEAPAPLGTGLVVKRCLHLCNKMPLSDDIL